MAVRLFSPLLLLFLLNCSVIFISVVVAVNEEKVILLHPNGKHIQLDGKFQIFCHENVPKSIFYVFRSASLTFEREPSDYKVYRGSNETEVHDRYTSESIWNPMWWLPWRESSIEFPNFESYCIGIKAKDHYSLFFAVRFVNLWKVFQMVLGIALFSSANTLSRNIYFHYASGVTLGVMTSVLIFLFIVKRFIPNNLPTKALLIFGYSFTLYFLHLAYFNLTHLLAQHKEFVLGYIIISATVSFFVCYRIGPIKDQRTSNIVQWLMQILAGFLIFFSSEYREFSTAIIVLVFATNFLVVRWKLKISSFWLHFFPPKVKLLTQMEYIEQGDVETRKALTELRSFCGSPQCDTWDIVRKLEKPERFANFVRGASHLTDEEILQYDVETVQGEDGDNLTEDES